MRITGRPKPIASGASISYERRKYVSRPWRVCVSHGRSFASSSSSGLERFFTEPMRTMLRPSPNSPRTATAPSATRINPAMLAGTPATDQGSELPFDPLVSVAGAAMRRDGATAGTAAARDACVEDAARCCCGAVFGALHVAAAGVRVAWARLAAMPTTGSSAIARVSRTRVGAGSLRRARAAGPRKRCRRRGCRLQRSRRRAPPERRSGRSRYVTLRRGHARHR